MAGLGRRRAVGGRALISVFKKERFGVPLIARACGASVWYGVGTDHTAMLLTELAHAMRRLRRAPTFAVTAIGTIAVALAVVAALASFWTNLVIAAQPGIRDPNAVLRVQPVWTRREFPYPTVDQYRRLLEQTPRSVTLAYYSPRIVRARIGHAEYRVLVHSVSPSYFAVLGTPMLAGAGLHTSAADDARIAVISWRFWHDRLDADPHAVGRRIALGGDTAYTIGGIAPRGFQGPEGLQQADVWVSLGPRTTWGYGRMIARLRPGITTDGAHAELNALWRRTVTVGLDSREAWARSTLSVDHLGGALHPENYRGVAMLLGGAAAIALLCLLIAAVNLAALVLTRALSRSRDLAVRRALGARRRDVLMQPTSEVVLLFLCALACGAGLAQPLGRGLVFALNAPFPFVADVHWNLRMIALTTASALAGALLCAAAPAMWVIRRDPADALRSDGGGAQLGTGTRRMQAAFIGIQVLIAFVLVTLSALVALRASHQIARDLGVSEADRVLAIQLPETAEKDRQATLAALSDNVRLSLGTSVVSTAQSAPGENGLLRSVLRAARGDGASAAVHLNLVSPTYFTVLRTTVLAGRSFAGSDRPGGLHVAIMSRSAAAGFGNPGELIGRDVLIGAENPFRATIVGVVDDIIYDLAEPSEPVVYVIGDQFAPALAPNVLLVRAPNGLAMTPAVLRADSTLRAAPSSVAPVAPIRTLEQVVLEATRGQRALVGLVLATAVLALALAVMGVFGLVSYNVQQRRREIAVRLALGDTPAGITRSHASHAARISFLGLLPGLALVGAASSAAAPLLGPYFDYLLAATAGAALSLLLAAVAASAAAVRRSIVFDPASLLRGD